MSVESIQLHIADLTNNKECFKNEFARNQSWNTELWFKFLKKRDYLDIADVVNQSVEFLIEYNPDLILISGSSRRILMPLFLDYPDILEKIVILKPETNRYLYKRDDLQKNAMYPESEDWYKERASRLMSILSAFDRGLSRESKVLMLEDFVLDGFKARDILKIMRYSDLDDYRFYTLTSIPKDNNLLAVSGEDMPYFISSKLKESSRMRSFFSRLKFIMRMTDPERIKNIRHDLLENHDEYWFDIQDENLYYVSKEERVYFSRILREIVKTLREVK